MPAADRKHWLGVRSRTRSEGVEGGPIGINQSVLVRSLGWRCLAGGLSAPDPNGVVDGRVARGLDMIFLPVTNHIIIKNMASLAPLVALAAATAVADFPGDPHLHPTIHFTPAVVSMQGGWHDIAVCRPARRPPLIYRSIHHQSRLESTRY